jgi:hypothetical protein
MGSQPAACTAVAKAMDAKHSIAAATLRMGFSSDYFYSALRGHFCWLGRRIQPIDDTVSARELAKKFHLGISKTA